MLIGWKGCDYMGLTENEHRKDEKIDGVIYDMFPTPDFRHEIID